jgi:hypothetical protein
MAFLAAGILVAAGSASAQSNRRPIQFGSREGDVERALAAAPPAIAAGAAVIEVDDEGKTTPLRAGDNGWTCLPRDPCTPTHDPVCVDRIGLAWFQAVMSGKAPDPDKVGYSYMLRGGSVWSATDPAATRLPEGEKNHVQLPPHLMLLNARLAEASGFPSGQAHPDTGKPFVLYGGTPFAIVILPLKSP